MSSDSIRAAVKRYTIGKQKVHPISEVDGEIMTEILEAVKKLNNSNNINLLVEILRSYKKKDDLTVLEDLQQWVLSQRGEETTETPTTPVEPPMLWIEFEGSIYRGHCINKIDIGEYKEDTCSYTVPKKVYYINIYYFTKGSEVQADSYHYNTQMERDFHLNVLKEKVKKLNIELI